jgi:O-antigen ligase
MSLIYSMPHRNPAGSWIWKTSLFMRFEIAFSFTHTPKYDIIYKNEFMEEITLNSSKKLSTKIRKKKYDEPNKNLYVLFSLCLIAGIIPLILYIKKITVTDPGNLYIYGLSDQLDIFVYYKMVFLLLFTAVGLIFFLFSRKEVLSESRKKLYYYPMAIFTLFIMISTLFSEYKQVSFFGFVDRYEGAFVLIGYLVIMFLAMNSLKEEKEIKILFLCLLASAFVISLIGTLQYFGIDYYRSKIFFDIVTPAALKGQMSEISSKFPENTIFTTLTNSNYVGSYMAMLLPIVLVFLVHSKKISHKIIFVALLGLIVLNWVGCESRAGIVGGVLALLFLLIMYRRKILSHKVIVLSTMLFICAAVFAANVVSEGAFISRFKSMISFEGKGSSDANNALLNSIEGLVDIKMDNEKTSIITEKGTVQIALVEKQLKLMDEKNSEVKFSVENDIINLEDERFKKISLHMYPGDGYIEVYFNDYDLIKVLFTNKGLRSPSNRWMTDRGNKEIEAAGFSGMESLGSNRGYIWSRSIPLLKDTVILGHGPDTFPIYFPQYDYVGKLRSYQTGVIFVDKPHNMYLQTAINTGIISLLALLAIFGIYFVSSFKLYFKEEFTSFLPTAGLACFAAFIGYTAAGMFNDSVVSVAPVFWVLLGSGIGINFSLYKNRLKNSEDKLPHR